MSQILICHHRGELKRTFNNVYTCHKFLNDEHCLLQLLFFLFCFFVFYGDCVTHEEETELEMKALPDFSLLCHGISNGKYQLGNSLIQNSHISASL